MDHKKSSILKALRVVMSVLLMGQGILPSLGVNHSFAATQQAMAIKVRIASTPNAIADLTAVRNSASDGELQLQWTVPSNTNGAPMGSYTLRYSTFSIMDTGGNTNNWWNQPTGVTSLTFPAAVSSGNPDFKDLSGLEPAVTYYFTMIATDVDGSTSPYDSGSQPDPNTQVRNYATDFAPTVPTGLSASSSDAQVALSWNANPESDIAYYRIYRDANTPPSSFVAITTTSATNFTDTGLTNGTSYYYRISAVDRAPLILESALSQTATGFPLPGIPNAPTNFLGTATATTSILWTWTDASTNESGFRVMASTGGAVSPDLAAGTVSYTETGLSINTAYTRLAQAFNIAGSSNSATAGRYTLAAPPLTLAATGQTTTAISMSWNANNNPAGTRFEISQSLDNFSTNFSTPVALVANHTSTNATITGLTSDTTYYFRVRAYNGDDIATAFSNTITVKTDALTDTLAPRHPEGFWGERSSDGTTLTIHWSNVTKNADNTNFANPSSPTPTELAGYNIYRSASYNNGYTILNPGTPVTSNSYSDSLTGSLRYYKVRAVDQAGNESSDSLVMDSSVNLCLYGIADDNFSYMKLCDSLGQQLLAANNKYSTDLTIQGQEQVIASDRQNRVYKYVRFTVVRSDTNQIVNDFLFPEPEAQVVLHYNVVGGQVAGPASQGLSAQGFSQEAVPSQSAAENLDLYWFNGIKWFKLGSAVDTSSQMVSYQGNHVGEFQIRRVTRAASFSFDPKNMSHKIFTPNGDNLNDMVTFFFDNPAGAEVTGKIFDLSSAYVADMTLASGTSLTWDGKDGSGAVVPAGVYVYQIKAQGKTFNGTVVVAR